jgi:mono/diheme cytochrome c family protein
MGLLDSLRSFALLILVSGVALATPYSENVLPLLRSHCASCHGGGSPAGGFAVETLARLPETDALQERERWEQISLRVRSGEMPPTGAPQPAPEQAAALVEWIEGSYERLDQSQPIDPGRVTARRLNRAEYSNSVRDLLGIDMNPAAGLPPDPYGYGFDNIGDVLSMNAGLTEQHLQAAEKVVKAAIPIDGDAPPPTMHRYLAERTGQDRQMRLHIDHAFPADGEYTLRTAFYQALKDGTQVRLRLAVDGRGVGTDVLKFYYQIDRGIEARGIPVTAGRHRIDASIEVLPEPAYTGSPPYLEYVQVYGPLTTTPAAETAAYARFFSCGHAPGGHDSAACAKRILPPLARRAFRRPVTADEIDGLLSFAALEEARSGSFEQAIRTATLALLVSPHFLFRVERDREGIGPHPLSDHELATRLSYFLWSSLPDEELSRLADEGRLSERLAEQAERMLADPKSAALVENFTGQWLQTRNLEVSRPDPVRFPEFTAELAEAMRRETELVFAAILQEGRSILELLNGRFTFLNERLATHYGLEGVTGDEFQRVELDGLRRGGVLTQAGVLTVSSYPTRTSPVIRGKWVLDNILNEPPPPPPDDVPALDESAVTGAGTMREQLEKHRANATCAACHARMDPLGFGLENYDAIGRWRDHEGETPIDASGVLPGGRSFTTPAELKAIMTENKGAFTRALAEKMLTYATGRGMELSDRPAVSRVARRVEGNGYRLRELVLAVVESATFRMRSARVESGGNP